MATYTKSNGLQIDTAEMPQPYLERAYAKAQEEGNEDNIKALEEEMQARGEQVNDNETDSEEDIISEEEEE